MQVAVASVAKGTHFKAVLGGDVVNSLNHGRNLRTRHGGVFKHGGGTGAGQHGQSHAAGFPQLELFGGVLGHVHGGGVIGLQHFFNGFGVVSNLGGVAVHFDQQNGTGFARQASLGKVVHAHDGVVVEEFKSTGHNVGGDDTGNGVGGMLHVREHGHQGLGGLGRRHELEDGFRNNAQRTLRLHHHAGEVVAGNALDRARTRLDHFARGVEKFDAHEVILGNAVLEAAQATGVFSNVTGKGRHCLGTRIGGVEQIFLGHGGGKFGGDHAGFNHSVKVVGIDFNNAVETGGKNNHGFRLVGNGAAGKVGSRAAHGHGDTVVIQFFHTLAELFLGSGAHHQRRHDRRQHRRIIRIAHAVGFGTEHVFLADHVFKIFNQRLACHKASLKVRHQRLYGKAQTSRPLRGPDSVNSHTVV